MSQRPTILMLIPHLGGGGAEQVVGHLAGEVDAGRYNLHLGLVTNQSGPAERVYPGVTVHEIGAVRVRRAVPQLVRLVHRLQPDVILSGMVHLNFLVLLLRPLFPQKTRILIRQNGPVFPHRGTRGSRFLYRFLYPKADGVICQTTTMADDLCAAAAVGERVRVLPNPVDVEAIRAFTRSAPCPWRGRGPHLLAVGRLAHEKGFDLLLHAFVALRAEFPHADLVILGEGFEKHNLTGMAHKLGIEDAIRFPGWVQNPAAWFAGATVFVMPSRWEGLSNAMLEAAAAGMPIVATPARGGMAKFLDRQPGVWMAPEISVSGLFSASKTALDNLEWGQRFPHPWIEEFRLSNSVRAYESLFEEILAEAQ